MTALTEDRNTPSRPDELYQYDMAASVKAFSGGIAVLDAGGNVKPGATATGLTYVGRFEEPQPAEGSSLEGWLNKRHRSGKEEWHEFDLNRLFQEPDFLDGAAS